MYTLTIHARSNHDTPLAELLAMLDEANEMLGRRLDEGKLRPPCSLFFTGQDGELEVRIERAARTAERIAPRPGPFPLYSQVLEGGLGHEG